MPHPFTYLLPVAALGLPGQWWVTATETMQLAKAKICTVWPLQNRASLLAQLVKNLPAMQKTPVRLLGREDPLEKAQATHSSILELPWWLSW